VEEIESFDQFLSLPSVKDDVLIEISSTSTASGKTALLSLLIVHAISPNQYQGVPLPGKDSAVVLFDNDDRFDVSIAFRVLKNHIKRTLEALQKLHESSPEEDKEKPETNEEHTTEILDISDNAIDSLARKCLQHLYIIRPESWSSLIANLDILPQLLFNSRPPNNSAAKLVSYVILDGASAFLWQRRAEEESRKILALDSHPSAVVDDDSPGYDDMLKRLRDLGRQFDCPVIVTTLQQPHSSANIHQSGNIAAATACLTVERVAVRPFTDSISFDEARDMQQLRREAVEKHEFRVRSGQYSVRMIMKNGDILLRAEPQDQVE
jgi:hypothetical protein